MLFHICHGSSNNIQNLQFSWSDEDPCYFYLREKVAVRVNSCVNNFCIESTTGCIRNDQFLSLLFCEKSTKFKYGVIINDCLIAVGVGDVVECAGSFIT
jgi:hypothetical protein